MIEGSERVAALPEETTLAKTDVRLEGRGFSLEVVDGLEAAVVHLAVSLRGSS